MHKNLTTIGNSLGIVIEKPILQLLGINRDTVLDMTTDGEALILRPVRQAGLSRGVADATEHVLAAHAETMRKLAQ